MPHSEQENYAQNRLRASQLDQRKAHIRRLNDALRTEMRGGRIVITSGVRSLGPILLQRALEATAAFQSFTSDNDPYGERDFGAVDVGRHRIFWKIDYYDKTLTCGSPDAANPDVTARVLTVMLASEY